MENWKPVPGYEGLYEVSDLGRVRSVDRQVRDKRGLYRNVKGVILKPSGQRPAIALSKDGKCITTQISWIVTTAFHGPKPSQRDVARHFNDKADDNRAENLCWGSYGDNARDRIRNGLTGHSTKKIGAYRPYNTSPISGEIWKAIPGFWDIYKVSDQGRVRSLDRIDCAGRHLKGRILRPGYSGQGRDRPFVSLRRDGVQKLWRVSRLVLAVFVGECPLGKIGCHRNDDSFDNRLSNLYYGTYKENDEDKRRNGGMILGERHHAARLTAAQVLEIIKLGSDVGLAVLARRFGVAVSQIAKIFDGKSWGHVTGIPVRKDEIPRRGITARGVLNGHAKFTETDIIEIRAAKGLVAHRKLAQKYGVCKTTISYIIARKTWDHVS